jgi:aspartate carbamoyltransferase catalytic subunit
MRHLGSIDDLMTDEVIAILDRAEELRTGAPPRSHVGQVLTLAFFQSSTRTRIGFASAGIRLGFGAVDLWADRYEASMSSPESLSDTIRVVSAYSDVMVLRHSLADAWATAIAVARCPVINGGNGFGEHPTQALVDLFAIRRAMGRLEGLAVGIVGDVRGSRSAHSLLKGLARFGPQEIRLMGPESMVDSTAADAWAAGLPRGQVTVRHDLHLRDLEIVYVAGLPEGPGARRLDAAARARFALTRELLCDLPETVAVLCPLPRIDEIATEVDEDRRARYFDQSDDALWVRMAVLEQMAGVITRPSANEPESIVERASNE